jgi:hypothetical protein
LQGNHRFAFAPDHFGGETLQKHLRDKYGWEIPVSAHRATP